MYNWRRFCDRRKAILTRAGFTAGASIDDLSSKQAISPARDPYMGSEKIKVQVKAGSE
jgi:hypothetical protein